MNNKPFISVCVPTYNGASYLRECLDSIVAQVFTDFEVLIVDDGSSDNTLEIAQEYASKDSRFIIYKNEKNLGLVLNWNHCVELARGEWIKFLFQDDLLTPDCLSKMVVRAKEGCVFVCCKRDFLIDADVDDKTRNFFTKECFSIDHFFPGQSFISGTEICRLAVDELGDNFIGEPTCVMIKKSAFFKYGLFHPRMVQICDLEYWLRIGIYEGIAYVDESLATFRVHEKATSHVNKVARKGRLDILILCHEFAFSAAYKPVRDFIKDNRPDFSLLDLLDWRIRNIRKAINQNKEPSHQRQQMLDFNQVLDYYPQLKQYPITIIRRVINKGCRNIKTFLRSC